MPFFMTAAAVSSQEVSMARIFILLFIVAGLTFFSRCDRMEG